MTGFPALQNLPRPPFPPLSLNLQPAFAPPLTPEIGAELLTCWSLLSEFREALCLPAFSAETLLDALLLGQQSPLLAMLHVRLLKELQADAEQAYITVNTAQVRCGAVLYGPDAACQPPAAAGTISFHSTLSVAWLCMWNNLVCISLIEECPPVPCIIFALQPWQNIWALHTLASNSPVHMATVWAPSRRHCTNFAFFTSRTLVYYVRRQAWAQPATMSTS